jgi:uncharacterized membrane protein
MFDWILLFVRDLNFTIWLGGLIVLDCIEAPARFRTPELDRNQIVAVGRQVFAAFNRAELLLGATLLLLSLWLLRTEYVVWMAAVFGVLAAACVSLMFFLTLAQFLAVRPPMTELSAVLDLVERDVGDARYGKLQRLHRVYVVLDIVKVALGLTALGCWSLTRMV